MGVNSKIYAMIGLNLPYGEDTEKVIAEGLGLNWGEDNDTVYEYFSDKGLTVNCHKMCHKGTYRFIMDGMNGGYIRLGLVLKEGEKNSPYDFDYFELEKMEIEPVRHMIKSIFGLDVPIEEIKTFVFTHFS